MSNIIPFNFGPQLVRVIARDGEPWFVAGDVAAVLGYREAYDMTRNLDDDEKGTHNVRTLGGDQEVSIISESGLYAAVLKSRKPEARAFRKWVTAEVLPTLRRTGSYSLPSASAEEPADALMPLTEMETQRLTAIVAVVRTAERLYGRPAAQAIWAELGLPDYAALSIDADPADPLALPLRQFLGQQESVTIMECADALGLGRRLDIVQRRRIGALLRMLGWRSRVERGRPGHPRAGQHRVFRQIAA